MFTFHSRLIRPTAPLLVALIVVSCAYRFIASSLVAAQEPAKPGANRINDLLKERLATVREIARLQSARFKNGQAAVEEVQEAIRRLLEAELELCDSLRDRIAVLEKYVDQAKDLEKIAALFFKTGQGRESSALAAKAERLRVEIALERAKAKAEDKRGANNTTQGVQDQLALAEKQLAIKRAALKVAEARKVRALARLATSTASVAEAQAAESFAEKRLKRFEELAKTLSVEERLVDEQRTQWEAAKGRRLTIQSKTAVEERQVALETAQVELAQAEIQEAELRLGQLQTQLRSQR